MILNCALNKKQSSQYLFYIPNEKNKQTILPTCKFESIFHFDRILTNNHIQMRTVPAACDFCIITAQRHWRMHRCDFEARNITCAQSFKRAQLKLWQECSDEVYNIHVQILTAHGGGGMVENYCSQGEIQPWPTIHRGLLDQGQ